MILYSFSVVVLLFSLEGWADLIIGINVESIGYILLFLLGLF